MSEIEKIQRYIKRTGGKFQRETYYRMNLQELFGLSKILEEDTTGAICLAFDYGRAKGYREAKAEARRT